MLKNLTSHYLKKELPMVQGRNNSPSQVWYKVFPISVIEVEDICDTILNLYDSVCFFIMNFKFIFFSYEILYLNKKDFFLHIFYNT